MAQRIKGQETEINVVSSTSGLQLAFSDVTSFTLTFKREVLEEQYLGQTTMQHDDTFNGVNFEVTIHSRTADVLSLIQRINEVSRGRLPGESIQIVSTLRFPDGVRRIVVPNCKFGDLPINIGGKNEYVEFQFSGSADDANILAA